MGVIEGCNSNGSIVVESGTGANGSGIFSLQGSTLTWLSGTDACSLGGSDLTTTIISGHCSNVGYIWTNGVALDVASYLASEGVSLGSGVDLEFWVSVVSPSGEFAASNLSNSRILLMRIP